MLYFIEFLLTNSSMTTTVNKREIIQQVAQQTGATQLLTREIIQATFDTIINVLVESGRLELRDFGVFEVKRRAAYQARNPLTGETVNVPEKNIVTFSPGKAMAEKVQKKTIETKKMTGGDLETVKKTPFSGRPGSITGQRVTTQHEATGGL